MGRQIRKSKGKTMKPNFFVFCEGESEVAYISHLRSQYRAPIQIIPRKSDSNISVRYIENCKREYVATKNDKTFLMFDLDVDGTSAKYPGCGIAGVESMYWVVVFATLWEVLCPTNSKHLHQETEKTSWTLCKGNFGIEWETATVRKDIRGNGKSQGVRDI